MAKETSFANFNIALQDVSKKLSNEIPSLAAMAVMVELEALHKKRIFDNGLKTSGEPIGEYSIEPGYFSKEVFIRKSAFKQKGKKNEGKFKNGKERKSMFLSAGYSEFRSIQGRQNDFVNIKYSGSAERSLGTSAFQGYVVYGIRDKKESIKLNGLNEKYGDFLTLSENEKRHVETELVIEYKKLIDEQV